MYEYDPIRTFTLRPPINTCNFSGRQSNDGACQIEYIFCVSFTHASTDSFHDDQGKVFETSVDTPEDDVNDRKVFDTAGDDDDEREVKGVNTAEDDVDDVRRNRLQTNQQAKSSAYGVCRLRRNKW